jgi:DNA-binding NarL/FixJ family response regulator
MCAELKCNMLASESGNSASKEIGELTENGSTAALIAARPGPLRDGLRALVRAIPQIKTLHQAGDIPSACQTIAKHRSTLVLLDSSMNGKGIESLLKTIRVQKAGCRCILLAENIQQQQEARAAGPMRCRSKSSMMDRKHWREGVKLLAIKKGPMGTQPDVKGEMPSEIEMIKESAHVRPASDRGAGLAEHRCANERYVWYRRQRVRPGQGHAELAAAGANWPEKIWK